jgi:hypothetical protein
MVKNAISDYSGTAASNTDVGGVDIQGSAAASNMDDAVRELMSHLADAAFGTSLSLTSTDAGATGPTLELYHNSASPAAVDEIGRIQFNGKDAGGNKTEYGRIRVFISDTTDGSEDGYISFATMKGSTLAEIMTLNPNAVTFSPASTFSVFNTNSDANALVFMGGNTGSTGGQIIAWGQSHATDASDVAIFSGGVAKYRYDASESRHEFTDPVESGTFSLTGASIGVQLLPTSGRISMSTTGTSASFPAALLQSQDIFVWNSAVGNPLTATVEIVTDNVTLKDDEAWLEIEYLGSSAQPISTRVNDRKANLTATGSNQTSSSVTWTTTGLATPVKQKLEVTFTPQMAGYVIGRVVLAKASTTMYACPKMTIA